LIAKPSFELTVSSAPQYLAGRGFDQTSLRVSELAGGVSNVVLLAETSSGRIVLKQALPQLRVELEWFSDLRRIYHECAALRLLQHKLPRGSVPEVLFEDQPNYIFAMTAAPPGSETWKSQLLRGQADPLIAERVAAILAALIRTSWHSPELAEGFGDITIFEELRLDPYYQRLATLYPALQEHMQRRMEACRTRRVSLVHGDWSPKNILVKDDSVVAIDFEVIHFGDPSFDAAFLLNHLLLKTFYGIAGAEKLAERFWLTLQAEMPAAPWFEQATIEHLGALLLARIDGKSPAEYIRDPDLKDHIRAFAQGLILDPPATIADIWKRYAADH
jgi:5-methylthioribose kinase